LGSRLPLPGVAKVIFFVFIVIAFVVFLILGLVVRSAIF